MTRIEQRNERRERAMHRMRTLSAAVSTRNSETKIGAEREVRFKSRRRRADRSVLALRSRHGVEIERCEYLPAPLLDGDGRHRGVVGTQNHRRDEQFDDVSPCPGFQSVAQGEIGRDAAADGKPVFVGLAQRLPALGDQHIDDGLLKAGGKVGTHGAWAWQWALGRTRTVQRVKHRRLQAAEAEFETLVLEKRTGQGVRLRIAERRLAFDRWAAGEAEAEGGWDFRWEGRR